MLKFFLKNSIIYILGTVLTRGIGVLLIPIYSRYLSPLEYGVVDLFLVLASIVSLTIALEINQAVVRFYQDTSNQIERMQYVSTAFIFSLFVYGAYFMISFLYSNAFTILLLNNAEYQNLFLFASGGIATGGVFYFTSGQLRWQILPKESVIVSIIHVLIVGIVSVYLLVIYAYKAESIFIGQIIGNTIGTFLSIYYARTSYKFVFNYSKFKEMISFSYPLVFSGVAIFVSLFIDRLLIKHFLGLDDLGVYGLAYKFAAITSLVMIGFNSSLSPLIYKHYQEEVTPKNIAKLFSLFLVFATIIVLGAILFSKEIVILMSTEAYYSAAPLIPVLVIAVFFSNMYIFVPGLSLAKKTKTIALISFISAVVNTILNLLFIPAFGLYGGSIATMISAIFVFYLYIKLSAEYYYIPYEWNMLILGFILSVGCIILMTFVLSDSTIFNFVTKMIIFMLISYFVYGRFKKYKMQELCLK